MARSAKKSKAEKMKTIKTLINGINKKAGENIVNFASEEEMAEQLKIELIPTVSYALNSAFGGIPKGKITLITGDPDTGKTSFLLETIGHAMQEDESFTCFWCESENSLSQELLNMFNIDPDRFIVHEVDPEHGSAEASMDIVIAMAQAGMDMVVVNSLKAMVPKKEIEDSMEQQNIALSARLNAKLMRKILSIISKSGTALCLVQQKSIDINSYGAPAQITGGRAILYSAVLTLDFNRVSIKSGDPYYEVRDDYRRIRCRVLKNHICGASKNPYTVTDYTVRLGYGTDIMGEILDEAYNRDIITKCPGGYFREYTDCEPHDKKNIRVMEDGTKCEWRGAANFQAYLDANPDYFDYIANRVKQYNISSKVEMIDQETIDVLEEANNETFNEEEFLEEIEDVLASNEGE